MLQLNGATVRLALGRFELQYYLNTTLYEHVMRAYRQLVLNTVVRLRKEIGAKEDFGEDSCCDETCDLLFAWHAQVDEMIAFERELALLVNTAMHTEYQ